MDGRAAGSRGRGADGGRGRYNTPNSNSVTVEDRRKDRKQQRREEREKARLARIQAQAEWSKARRAAKMAREAHQPNAEGVVVGQGRKQKRSRSDVPTRDRGAALGGSGKPSSRGTKKETKPSAFLSEPERPTTKRMKKKQERERMDEEVEERPKKKTKTSDTEQSGTDDSKAAGVSALQTFRRTERADAPPALTRLIHGCVNKLTVGNMMAMVDEIAQVLRGAPIPSVSTSGKAKLMSLVDRREGNGSVIVSRATVVACLMDELDRWGSMDTEGALSTLTTGLPFAGLLRGLQLLGGDIVSADIVERLCRHLHRHVQGGEEEGGNSCTMLLALLYRLCGVDATLMVSLLRFLLGEGERVATEAGADSTSRALPAGVLCAASCALTLLRACGEKMLKETPTEMEALVKHARDVAASLQGREGATRYAALVQVMQPIVRGHTRTAKRKQTEGDAPVEALFSDLKTLLPQYSAGGRGTNSVHQQRLLNRVIQAAHTISGVRFEEVLQEDKPPQWWSPDTISAWRLEREGGASLRNHKSSGRAKVFGEEESSATSDESEEEEEEEKSDEDTAAAAQRAKQLQIQRMRAEEKAASGQRFNTEHTREVFRCLTAAADDLEAFALLMHRDPGYTRFHDVCRVIIQCCVQEKQYNRFYASVLERFCHARRSCRTVLQFALWDHFKTVRLLPRPDMCGFLNLSCLLADLIENEVASLSVLRGLDLEETNKCTGLLARMILLRLLVALSGKRFTTVFFGGDGRVALDFKTDTSALRTALEKILQLYFDDAAPDAAHDGASSSSGSGAADTAWLKAMYDVVAAGTPFDIYQVHDAEGGGVEGTLRAFQKRVRVARRAIRQGIW